MRSVDVQISLPRVVTVAAYPAVIAFGLGLHALLSDMAPAWLAAYLPVAIAAIFITIHERFLPERRAWRPARAEVVNDAAFLAMVQVLLPYLLSLLVVLTAAAVWQGRSLNLTKIWPHHWPIALQALLMLIVADFLRYWLHRANHRIPFLWRLHAVHHAPRRLYWLNVGRFHPLEKALQYTLDSLPFVLLGVSGEVLSLYFVFYALNGFYQHSNCAVRLGWLNYIVSGPELHRWHHSSDIGESSSNFGNNLIVWDWLFDTRFLPEHRQVGALGLGNRAYPKGFWRQQLAPFTVDPNVW